MKRGTVYSIFKLKAVRKPVIDKMTVQFHANAWSCHVCLHLLQSHYYRTPEFFANNENFSRFQLARKEHNASLNSNKFWADRCPPTSSITYLTSCKNVVYQRYHAAKVGMFSESAKRIKDFLWLATKKPLRLWWRGKYQKNMRKFFF